MAKIFKGLDVDGNDILFIGDVESDASCAVEAIEKQIGVPIGEPAPGAMAREVAELSLVPSIESVVDGAETQVADPEKPTFAQELNKRLIEDGMRFFAKADQDYEGLAIGIVMEPNDGVDSDKVNPDTQGDIFSAEVIRKAAYSWLSGGGAVDFMHSFKTLDKSVVQVVGSDVTHGPVTLGEGDGAYSPPVGTWLLTTKWDTKSQYWQDILSGKLGAYSPGGMARGEQVNG